ncbi:Wzz/FepE/Etk N-terminal domain-containing protein [Oceanospirillaceae bacterium]|nr:Wzz/FepE/Etk N-terminal domain-containing protein [Oceanospirillaceae bacterium]MDC1350604.1 Wzz/FepE/Etk N-terminal domain-containing protein [Oceanospirillaceae bacterium]
MNDSGHKQYDDEIDLFEIIEIVWQGKWIIVASMFIVLAAAYAYQMYKEDVYEYNLSYSPITAADADRFNKFVLLSDLPFTLNTKSKSLSLISTNPNYEAVVSSEVAIIGNKLTQSLIDEANLTLKEIEDKSQRLTDEKIDEAKYTIKEIEYRSQLLIVEAKLTLKLMKEDILPVHILNSDATAKRYFDASLVLRHLTDDADDIPSYIYHSDAAAQRYFKAKSVLQNSTDGAEDTPIYIYYSDAAAKRYFEAKSVLQKISDGENTIEFQPVVKTAKSSTIWLFPVLPAIMGGVVGALFIFLLRIIAGYKKRQQTAI